MAWRFTGNKADAEDLLQDVLVKLYPQLALLREVDQLRPWLARVLYRSFVDSVRRQKQAGVHLTLVAEYDEQNMATIAVAENERFSPESQVLHTQLENQLASALGKLDDSQRALITLHDMEGYSVEEVAELMDIPAGTVKSRLHRLRARLRRFIKPEPFLGESRVKVSEEAKP